MKAKTLAVSFVALILCFADSAIAQTATGMPPYSTIAGGAFDSVDLANLNVHFAIPVLSKAGRGIPFDYTLSYDSLIWRKVTSGTITSWQPVSGIWGWKNVSENHIGLIGNQQVTYGACYDSSHRKWTNVVTAWQNWYYRDKNGTVHNFAGQTDMSDYDCEPPISQHQNLSASATDGSGYRLVVTNFTDAYVLAPSGAIINPIGGGGSTFKQTDNNGNQISNNGASFYDTLSSTTPVVTVSGTGTVSSPQIVTYTAPSGDPAHVTINYTNLTIKTNFACSGVTDYGPIANTPLVTSIVLPDGSSYQFDYEPTPGFSGDYTGRIHSVTLPTGGQIVYTYSGSNNGVVCADGSTAGLSRQTPDGTWGYTRTAGSGAAYTTVATDPDNNQTKIQFQGLYQTKKQVYQGSTDTGALLQTVDTCYNGNTTISTCTSTAVTLPISRVTSWTAYPSSAGKQNRSDVFYNSYGLPTEVDEYDFGNTGAGPGAMLRKTTTGYATLGNGIVNRPSTVSVFDGGSNLKAQTTYGYDESTPAQTSGTPQHVIINGARGNLTSIHRSTGATTLDQTFTYYDTGNVNVASEPNTAQTTYTYGACGNSFPTSVALPTVNIALTRSATWNCTGGVITSATDENGNVSYTNYTSDPNFWRPNSTTDAASNTTTFSYRYVSNPGPFQVESQLNFNGNSSTVGVATTTDSYGRTKLVQKRQAYGAAFSGNYDSTQTDYDTSGRVWKQYLPFQAAAGSTAGSFVGTTTSYDALGRATSITDSGNGSVSVSYTYNDVYQSIGPAPTGESAKRKQFEYDGLGRLSSVCEVTSASGAGSCGQSVSQTGYSTRYTYDTLGNLTGVTQNAQGTSQSRSFSFDRLSRMTSETNPENGTTNYTYDSDGTCGTSNGDLVKRVDAVGNVTCYHYDALHRVTYTSHPSGQYASVTPSKYYVYDSATINGTAMANPKNRLVEAYTCTSCSPLTKITDLGFSYSVRGEITDVYQWSTHSGGWYHVSGTYWANGALNVLSGIPGLPTITYGADSEGRVSTVIASSGQNPIASTAYTLAGQPKDVTLGSGDSDHYTYDSNTGRMTQYKFTIGATPQNVTGTLGWNSNGSLASLQIADPFNVNNNQTCTYAHDDLSRIASVNCGSVWSQSFGFDPFGNISKAGSISFAAGYVPDGGGAPNNRIQTGIPNVSYDANGNLLTINDGTTHAYSWDAEGRQVSIDTTSATYDAQGRLVELNKSGTYSQIVYGLNGARLAVMSGQTLTKAFVATPSGSAVYAASGLSYYRHSDWLGSSRFASTTSQTMYSSSSYAPFGEQYRTAGTSDSSFTGQEQDTAAGLYDFLFRRLSQVQGRWLSPDPSGITAVSISNPQTWNRYGYVGGGPLSAVDYFGLNASSCDASTIGLCSHAPSTWDSTLIYAGAGDMAGGYGANMLQTALNNYLKAVEANFSGPVTSTDVKCEDGTTINVPDPGLSRQQAADLGVCKDHKIKPPPCSEGAGPLLPGQKRCSFLNRTPWNGNTRPGLGDQDDKCSPPMPDWTNSVSFMRSCCQEHDNCYESHNCNSSSWKPWGFPGVCKLWCNIKVTICFASGGIL